MRNARSMWDPGYWTPRAPQEGPDNQRVWRSQQEYTVAAAAGPWPWPCSPFWQFVGVGSRGRRKFGD